MHLLPSTGRNSHVWHVGVAYPMHFCGFVNIYIGEEFFIIQEGSVKVVEKRPSPEKGWDAPQEVTLVTLREGHFFGEMSLVTSEVSSRMFCVCRSCAVLSCALPALCVALLCTMKWEGGG